jgi:hypothetical protein
MSEVSFDRAAQICAELKRRLDERNEETLAWLRDVISDALYDREHDTRAEYEPD